MKTNETTNYFTIIVQSYDRVYYAVVGREIGYNDGVRFLTKKEADDYADKLNSTLQSRTLQAV
jgi:hypothetical protein